MDDDEINNELQLLFDVAEDQKERKKLRRLSDINKTNNNNIIIPSSDEEDHWEAPVKPTKPPIAELKGLDTKYHIKYPSSTIRVVPEDDSDDDIATEHIQPYQSKFPNFPLACIDIGLRVKLLANVYLRKIDQTANIFLPLYIMELAGEDNQPKEAFFRTPKGEVCVFASGGMQNVWEKTVAEVLQAFKLGPKIKVIRARWIQKHLWKDQNISRDIEEEFKGREIELHSEFYYDIFFRHFFLKSLPDNIKSLTIYAYSWWDVCNSCESYLSHHRTLFKPGILSYKIAASRKYKHLYPPGTILQNAYIPSSLEESAWQRIWKAVMQFVHKNFNSPADKENFWTTTKQGLDVSKWLGQAFIENTIAAGERKAKPLKKGDILKFQAQIPPQELEELNELLAYLRDKNWDLSCWYKAPYSIPVQKKWKLNWRQVVMPHFDWEVVYTDEDYDGYADCDMCGYQGIRNINFVFHPKFRVSKTFLQPREPRTNAPSSQEHVLSSQEIETPLLQKKKMSSICVGSECVQFVTLNRQELLELQQRTTEEQEQKWNELEEREANLEALDNAEKQMEKRKRGHRVTK